MVNEKRLIMTEQEAIAKAEQELSTSHYIAECTRSPGMRAIHDKRCSWLSVIVGLAKKATNGDAVEVVHGHWYKAPHHPYRCSNCGEMALLDMYGESHYRSNYCPNCGAKMDGGNEDV